MSTTESLRPATPEPAATTSRRHALQAVGGGAALAALAALALPGRVVGQQATPAAGHATLGLHVLARSRIAKPEKTEAEIEALNDIVQNGLLPLLREIPGFVDYYVVWNESTRERVAVNIFRDKAGAEATVPLAANYLAEQGMSDFYVEFDPVITEGTIVVAADAGA